MAVTRKANPRVGDKKLIIMKKLITHLIQSKNYVLTLALSVSILAGCKKEIAGDNILDNTPVPVNYLDHVKFLNQKNILVFENHQVLKQIIADNLVTTGKTVDEMKARFPAFISMAGIYSQFDKKEAALIENLDDSALSSTNVDWTKYLKMSDIGKAYSDMILVKQFADNQEYYYEMNISEKHYAEFVNPEGLMVVNDTIYQFSAGYVKLITDGDYSKIAMLSNTTVSSPAEHILVIKSKDFMLGWFQTTATPPNVCTGPQINETRMTASGSGTDERRVEINVRFEQHPVYLYSSLYNWSSCSITFVSAKKKQLIIARRKISHIWVDAYPRSCRLSGGFSKSRSPAASAYFSPAGGYNPSLAKGLENPLSGIIPMKLGIPFEHYIDYSGPFESCYKMEHGSYKLEADFGLGIIIKDVSYSW